MLKQDSTTYRIRNICIWKYQALLYLKIFKITTSTSYTKQNESSKKSRPNDDFVQNFLSLFVDYLWKVYL